MEGFENSEVKQYDPITGGPIPMPRNAVQPQPMITNVEKLGNGIYSETVITIAVPNGKIIEVDRRSQLEVAARKWFGSEFVQSMAFQSMMNDVFE